MNCVIICAFISITFLVQIDARSPKFIHRAPIYHRYRFSKPRHIALPERKTFHNLKFHQSSLESGHENGWGWENNLETDDIKAKEIVKFVNHFLGVMGPFLFPLPYVLALIPFAIPAIPLSFWLETREHHRPESGHESNGTEERPSPTTPSTTLGTTPTTRRSTIPSSANTTPNPTLPTTATFITFPTLQTTNVPNNGSSSNGGGSGDGTSGGVTISPDGSENSSFTNTTFPIFNMSSIGPPPDFNPVTLFPFTLFLNSSFLGDDYNHE